METRDVVLLLAIGALVGAVLSIRDIAKEHPHPPSPNEDAGPPPKVPASE